MNYEIEAKKYCGKNYVHITSQTRTDMKDENKIVLLHIPNEGVKDEFFIIHDSDGNSHQVTVPVDCIDTLILALQKVKEGFN